MAKKRASKDIINKLRSEILNQLSKVNQNPQLTPNVYQIIQTERGYRFIEDKIIEMMIADGITVSAAIPQIESEL